MVNQKTAHIDHLHEFAALYQNKLQQQLSRMDNAESPIALAFNKWLRALSG
jgi:hypothetical protein